MIRLVLILLSVIACIVPAAAQENPDEIRSRYLLKQSYQTLAPYTEPNVKAVNEFLLGLLPSETNAAEAADLIKGLSGSGYADREAAETDLVAMGVNSLGALAKASQSETTETRVRAKRAIARINHSMPQVIEAAIEVVSLDPSEELPAQQRLETIFAVSRELKNLDFAAALEEAVDNLATPEIAPAIAHRIRTGDRESKLVCISVLAKCFSTKQLSQFTDLVVDDDLAISQAAVQSLGAVAPQASVSRLVNVLIRCDDQKIRTKAITNLRALSGNYFGLEPAKEPATQAVALEKWQTWFTDNSPFNGQLFLELANKSKTLPTGFLVSTNGSTMTLLDVNGKVVWNLQVPLYDARPCLGKRYLVCERSANRVRLLSQKGASLRSLEGLSSPADAELLANDHILVLQSSAATEHDSDGKEIKRFPGLQTPFDVDRLANGNTLVADSGGNRIVEFNAAGREVWQAADLAFPNNAFRLQDGRTLYTTYTSGLVGLLKPDGKKEWEVQIAQSTLYSVYHAAGQVFVADGRGKRIVILDMNGEQVKQIPLNVDSLCDVGFVTAENN